MQSLKRTTRPALLLAMLLALMLIAGVARAGAPCECVTDAITRCNKAWAATGSLARMVDAGSYDSVAVVEVRVLLPYTVDDLKDLAFLLVKVFLGSCGEHQHEVAICNSVGRRLARGHYSLWSGIKVEVD